MYADGVGNAGVGRHAGETPALPDAPACGRASPCYSARMPPSPAIAAAPTPPTERIETLDVLRGFALHGILLMNILAFGLPFQAYFDPTIDGAVAGLDFGIFFTVELFAEGVMRALFSMLFGAGVVILAGGPNPKPAGVYYRRQLWLLAFGLVDAFVLLWTGDILVLYAMAGMLLYAVRDWSPRRLFILAGVLFGYLGTIYALLFAVLTYLPAEAEAAAARVAAGEEVSAAERAAITDWAELKAELRPPPEQLAKNAVKFEGPYPAAFRANAAQLGALYGLAYPLFLFWDALAGMALGMALFKVGVLRGARSGRFFAALAGVGFAVGLAVNGFELAMKIGSGYALRWASLPTITYDVGRIAMALGFLGVIALACQRGWFRRLRRALAAVGRMALTNYLAQSVIGLLVFTALGLGLWNEMPRHQLYMVVLAEWVVLTAFSVWWLGRFRFGPVEWLWRTLTYGARPAAKARSAGT